MVFFTWKVVSNSKFNFLRNVCTEKEEDSSKRGRTYEEVRKTLEASNKFVDTIRDIGTIVL